MQGGALETDQGDARRTRCRVDARQQQRDAPMAVFDMAALLVQERGPVGVLPQRAALQQRRHPMRGRCGRGQLPLQPVPLRHRLAGLRQFPGQPLGGRLQAVLDGAKGRLHAAEIPRKAT
ncbi:hypothetical protein XPU_3413 [Xanthomonas arboricola pv. pruni str. MAFF 311562]|uniref:Uncharacterized protein n=1 Tax=Xanthomonas arboricola pv. pruni str. MAFF 311562 TaxID=1414836 RepID=W4S5U6_9XANT|nr:hypothetical protein XPU_3413 [Xanthomonas arboricola pv. pruni str. MAFF 311562]